MRLPLKMENNNVSATNVEVPVTTKNPRKAKVVKRLAEWNRKKLAKA